MFYHRQKLQLLLFHVELLHVDRALLLLPHVILQQLPSLKHKYIGALGAYPGA